VQEQPTSGRPYKSRFGGGYISGVQYLAENMCARLARRDRVELHERFWKSARWEKEFRLQTVHAAKLLKDYSMEAIIAALQTTRGKQVYSLGLKSVLVPIIKDEQEKLDRKKAASEVKVQVETPPPAAEPPRPNFVGKQTLLGKLREI